MLRILKRFSWAALLAASLQLTLGFSLLGPVNEAYQVQVIGYNLPEDVGAPKNLAQEFRRNTPVMYYTCDANFWDYFGSRGVAEIDKAFAVFNNLPKVSSMSADLSEYPLQARRKNWRAEALYMLDIKSWVMALMLEQLGLAEPERYIWTLHDRWLLPNTTCPFGEVYLVVKRNFDPFFGASLDQLKPTSYVNGVLFTYQIPELCTAPLPPQAWCQPIPVDAEADPYSPVASLYGFNEQYLFSPYGTFFTGLTRDDVGGLRYLLRTNNMNIESAGPNTVTLVTNTIPSLLTTSNLTLLASQALTNDAPPLQALYPNLVVLSTSNWFTNVWITNSIPYFTNYPWDPVGSAPHLVFSTNITPTVEARYQHLFGNVLQLIPTPYDTWVSRPLATPPPVNGQSWVTIETSVVAYSNNPWGPVGSLLLQTNTTYNTYLTNDVVGEYVILPTNMCEIAIITSQLTNVVSYTNPIVQATNIVIINTNNPGGTNLSGTVIYFSQNYITYFTNHTFVIFPVICDQTNTALRQGVEKIKFIRRDYDSLLNRFFTPITNEYTLNAVTNFQIIPQKVRRVVTAPDFLFTCRDLTAGPEVRPYSPAILRSINFTTNGLYPGLAGPGTIEPATTFTFNNVGPLYYNTGLINSNRWLMESDHTTLYIWGSYDATTNAPVIYPNDVSIMDMENQVLVQVTPTYLPTGVAGVDYSATLQSQGSTSNWQPPYYWGLAPGSPGLPPGLQLITAGDGSGLIYGNPFPDGTYDFVIRVTDSLGHTVDRSFAITIIPPDGGG
jgi:hypothetical protein